MTAAAGRCSPWPRTTTTRRVCPTPKALTNLAFEQQTVVYDRTGKVELARLGELKREVVTFDQIPPEMLDATTAIEDKDFWVNPGFDPVGIVSAGLDTLSGRPRGASTITQQLVRARLLPPRRSPARPTSARSSEIIQSIRLTAGVSRARRASSRSSPPTSTRTSTATRATG